MPLSVYLHIPFCRHRCAYCDFNTYAGQEALIPAYVDALCREIEFVCQHFPAREMVHTIFFGGGTPSLLAPSHFEQILATVWTHFVVLPDAEISLEANPGTLTPEGLRALRTLGFNRLSLGVQSFHPQELRQLERIHDPLDVFDALRWARRAGFDNLNVDLIYGLPEQSLDRWVETIRRAVSLAPEHLSLYALTIETGTPFGRWAARGLLPLPDPDAAAEMYERAAEILLASDYIQYEISNWARDDGGATKDSASLAAVRRPPSFACRHNLTYWRAQPYLGFGAGAHGYVDNIRYSNVLRIRTYLERLSPFVTPCAPLFLSPAVVSRRAIRRREAMQEMLMLGLRLTREGVSAQEFADRFGVRMTEVFENEIAELIHTGLLEWAGDRPFEALRLTPRARLLGNQVFMRFVD
jgi:oxygen-independent coproporphyrinogen-3 oxidase